jgi:hypothetical protein
MKPKPDAGYKLLFSAPEIVRDLITGFIGDPWVEQLDLDTLEKLPTNYVDRRLRQRLTDAVWRVRTKDQGWAYLYLLIEFQSRSDHWMALRVMGYVALLWQDLLRSDRDLRRSRRLPPVLPVVIHNGAQRWRAVTDVAELLPALPDGLASYAPRMKYLLLDKNRFDDAQLRPMRNLLASVMRLERNQDDKTYAEALAGLGRLVAGAPELKRVFSQWLEALFANRPDVVGSGALELQETEMGIVENFDRWKKEYLAQGRQEGLQAGRQELVSLLQAQLAARFGPLPPEIVERIAAGTPEQVSNWGLRMLAARSLEDVFAN